MNTGTSPHISVIIPAYNYAKFLPETIGSVIAQTYPDWQCLVIDDGSSDNTKEVVTELMKHDSRIHYYYQENSGPTVARNLGLKLAKGEFIQFLDADDLIENKKFEKQLQLFKEENSPDVVYGNVYYFKSSNPQTLYNGMALEGSKPWMKKLSGSGKDMILAFLNENLMVIQAPLFKKKLVDLYGSMDEELFYNEDWELWTRFAIHNAKFKYDESEGTNSLVRVHESYSNDNFKMFIHGLHASLKMNARLTDRIYKKVLIPKIAYHKRIIDEKLIEILKKDRVKAAAQAALVADVTGLERYKKYARLFNIYPVWFWYLYSKFLFVVNKLKNVILYA